MNNERSNKFFTAVLLLLISAAVYLPFIGQFGYFNDDWYLMYAAGTRGPSVFWDIFAVDRPLRALVMIPAYSLFGPHPFYYNISAFVFRLISAFCFLWILRMVWKEDPRITFWMSLLFLLYPGFLSQPNAIDYLCHIVGLAGGMLSIVLTVRAVQAETWPGKFLNYSISIVLGWLYLGQIEWYIGLEFFRFACILVLSFRMDGTMISKVISFFKNALPAALIPGAFLIWRLFFFESERGATDVDLQFGNIRGDPAAFLFKFLSTLSDDVLDVLLRAWGIPLRRLSYGINNQEWLPGYGIALLVIILLWAFHRKNSHPVETASSLQSGWKREVIWISLGMLICGLLPVLLVDRTVDFKSFSRYTLIAAVGASLLLPILISYIPRLWLHNVLFGILVVSAVLTHYANGLVHARSTQLTRNFWQQVGWRIPQVEVGTTLIAHYPVVAEEDYFTWGPANLIYYPDSNNEKYVQPSIYAALLNKETVDKVLAGEGQEFSNRRSIRTYPNYRNILILTQPSSNSCMQVIDLHQVELSSAEDARIGMIAAYSETEHILIAESFHVPPVIPFGVEAPHEWCYYYEKAAHARQLGDWAEVARLGEEADSLGFSAKDQIEWMPFIQAYASLDDLSRLKDIASSITSDPAAAGQACQILRNMSLSSSTAAEVQQLFCLE